MAALGWPLAVDSSSPVPARERNSWQDVVGWSAAKGDVVCNGPLGALAASVVKGLSFCGAYFVVNAGGSWGP